VVDPEDRARGRGAKGVWDAVDTGPDLGGQNVLKPSKSSFNQTGVADTNGIRESFLSLDLFSLTLKNILCLQCYDTVGWAAGRASGL